MGMFSYIYCKKELPLNEELKTLNIKWEEQEFQTKDLDNCLETYIIQEDGSLVEQVVEFEYTYYTDEEKKHKDHKPWNIIKDQNIVKQYTKDVNYHGKIVFYDTINFNEDEDIWVDFAAYYIYGKLDKIELSKIEKYKSRKNQNEKFWEEYKKEQNSLSFKIKKYSGWFWFWKKIGLICYRLSAFFGSINSFIIKNIR